MKHGTRPRNLILILGDQLDERSTAFEGFDAVRCDDARGARGLRLLARL
jgi:hypothetical protein